MIVVELKGGLGNQLFQYALGRYLAECHRSELLLDTAFLLNRAGRERGGVFRDYALDLFAIEPTLAEPAISRRYGLGRTRLQRLVRKIRRRCSLPGELTYLAERTPFRADDSILRAPDNCYLSGYWQARAYVEPIAGLLRRELTFRRPLPPDLQSLARRMTACEAVCLHVRRGDFVGNPRYDILSPNYFRRAEEEIRKRLPHAVLFVFSDDLDWCRRHLHFRGSVEWVGDAGTHLSDRLQFQLMAYCRHFIIPNSTFSWWAAFLQAAPDSLVVAPRIWLHDGEQYVMASHLKYPHWIQV